VPALLAGTRLFGLTWFGAGALYFVVWWTLLFVVLPFRARDDGSQPIVPGQDLGAPPLPQMRRKVLWTTLLSDVVFVAAIAAFPLAGL
jgi:predicted secreted protein